jgi:hypothetical protein
MSGIAEYSGQTVENLYQVISCVSAELFDAVRMTFQERRADARHSFAQIRFLLPLRW